MQHYSEETDDYEAAPLLGFTVDEEEEEPEEVSYWMNNARKKLLLVWGPI